MNPLINPLLTADKQTRKEKYSALAVQSTNNSSIVSKRSVESIYYPKFDNINRNKYTGELLEYLKFFVPKFVNRSPCINRGYWLRLHAIRSRLDSILSDQDSKVVIINLGCGFDPLPFQLLDPQNKSSSKYQDRCIFLDIDYSDLLMKKIQIISNNVLLSGIVGTNMESPDSNDNNNNNNNDNNNNNSHNNKLDRFTSSNYFIRPCDLNDTKSFCKLLLQSKDDLPFLYDNNNTKIFIAEVSLAYMKPELSDEIIRITSQLPQSHFIILEQLIPKGPYEPFAKQMLKHFTNHDSPLLSVTKYPTLQSQIDRFKKLGYVKSNAGDMFQLWHKLPSEIKDTIESVQPFDELEEFHLFCHHYILVHSTNDPNFTFSDPYLFDNNERIHKTHSDQNNEEIPLFNTPITDYRPAYNISIKNSIIKRTFGASASLDKNRILYFGGCTPYRVNELLLINLNNNEITTIENSTKENVPLPRTCHTFVKLQNQSNMFLLIGGRNAPHKPYKDVWLYDFENNKWEQRLDLPEPRFRHCSVALPTGEVIVFGGQKLKNADPSLLLYNPLPNEWTVLDNISNPIPNLISSSMDFREGTNKLVIAGGYDPKTDNISDNIYIYDVQLTNKANKCNLTQVKVISHPFFQRYGSKLKFIDDSKIVLVGGTSASNLFDASSYIIMVNIDTEKVYSISIPSRMWQETPLMFVGFELVWEQESRKLTIMGGGATCYGFGTVSNSTLIIQL